MNGGDYSRGISGYENGQLLVEFNEMFARPGAREVVVDGLMWVLRGGIIAAAGRPFHGFRAVYRQALAPQADEGMFYRVDILAPASRVQLGYCRHGGFYLSSRGAPVQRVAEGQYREMRMAVRNTALDTNFMAQEADQIRQSVGDVCVNQLFREYPALTPASWEINHGPSDGPCSMT